MSVLSKFRTLHNRKSIARLLLGQKVLWLLLTTVLAVLGGLREDVHASRNLYAAALAGPSVIMVFENNHHAEKKQSAHADSGAAAFDKLVYAKHKARFAATSVVVVTVCLALFVLLPFLDIRDSFRPPAWPYPSRLTSHGQMSLVRLLI